MAVTTNDTESSTQLQHRSLGVASIVFFVVAASAPLTVVAGGVPVSFAVSVTDGGFAPLSTTGFGA